MDGFSITLYIKQLLLMIAMLDPSVSATEVSSLEAPQIITVSPKYYVENICECTCSEKSIYGRFFLDLDGKPALLITTPNGGDIPMGIPSMDALMLHELTHYVQYVQGKYKGALEDSLTFSEEELKEIYTANEEQAYQNQSNFLSHHNQPTFDIATRVAWSTETTESCDKETTIAAND